MKPLILLLLGSLVQTKMQPLSIDLYDENVWLCFFFFFGYLQKNLLIHVILSDDAGPACSYWERTSALKCLLSPRTQTGESLGVISHSVIIFVQKYYGVFERKFKLTSEQKRRRKHTEMWVWLWYSGKAQTLSIKCKLLCILSRKQWLCFAEKGNN